MCKPNKGYYMISKYNETFTHGSAANHLNFTREGEIVIQGNFSGTEPELPETVAFLKCDASCLSCKGPSDKDCTSCWAGKRLNVAKNYTKGKDAYPFGTCESQCETSKYVAQNITEEEKSDSETFWANSGGWICKNCHHSCFDCDGPLDTDCSLCRYPDAILRASRNQENDQNLNLGRNLQS
jgi:hypothetical protein